MGHYPRVDDRSTREVRSTRRRRISRGLAEGRGSPLPHREYDRDLVSRPELLLDMPGSRTHAADIRPLRQA
jgi:hypothetical protein